ncbi:MAG: SurA N-terminal domain-containing protein [Desulfohalobiaceae bacterium]
MKFKNLLQSRLSRQSSFLLSIVFLLLLFWTYCGEAAANAVDKVVAVVNDEVITKSDLEREMDRELKLQAEMRSEISSQERENQQRQVLEYMINNILFQQEADRLKIQVSDSEVERHLERIKKEHGLDSQDLKDFLAQQDMDIQQYKQWLQEEIKRSRLLSSMVRQKVVVTEEEIQDYYEENEEQFQEPGEVELQLILHTEKSRLQEIKDQIDKGELEFEEAARKFSQGPGAEQAGKLGSLDWNDLSKSWQEALLQLRPGEMSEVFAVQEHYALILLQEKHIQSQVSLQEVQEDIRQRIYQRKLEERYQEYVQNLRSRAAVDVRL